MNRIYKILPYFPLGVFLLPGEDIPLTIFEPRYLQLIEEAGEEGYTFAVPFMKGGVMQDYGCEVKLQQVVAESKQGRKVITIESLALVKIHSLSKKMNGKLYDGGSVEVLTFNTIIEDTALINLIVGYTDSFDTDFLHDLKGSELRYLDIVKALNLTSEEKYNFLMLDNDAKRVSFLIHQLRFLMLIRKQEQLLDNDFQLN